MKRLFVILVCFSILYGGALSAFAGCENLIAAAAGHDHGDTSDGHHHGAPVTPQHHGSGEIHCPDLLGAFVVGFRSPVESERRVAALVAYPSLDPSFASFHASALIRFVLGPPGPTVSQLRPLHLLLSVIRI